MDGATRFINGYSDSVYAKMRDDVTRTEAYRQALQQVAKNKTVVDIGTGALALLAVFAAQAGARKVCVCGFGYGCGCVVCARVC